MNENAKAWIAALRSKKYTQTKQYLHDKDGFCCLGVACELAIADGVPLTQRLFDDGGTFYIDRGVIDYGGTISSLPSEVKDWLGIDSDLGNYQDFVAEDTCLAWKNDGGKTFEEIADIIESEPEGLFKKAEKA
jgi:hypothetical protein